jgi:kumamolisin
MSRSAKPRSTGAGQEVLLRLLPSKRAPDFSVAELGKTPVHLRRHMEPRELLNLVAADAPAGTLIKRFAGRHHLTVQKLDLRHGLVVLSGSTAALEAVFRSRKVPSELAGVVEGVWGFDAAPAAKRPRHRTFPPEESLVPPPVNPKTRPPKDFRQLYKFPRNATGKGQTIAVLEFGGGFSSAKLRRYLKNQGVRMPRIIVREIGKGRNQPIKPTGLLTPDAEVYMDLEILASLAPDATLMVYFAENSARGWIEALEAALLEHKHKPSVLSISWGFAEQEWDPQTIRAVERLLQMAAVLGITVCCPSGDRGVYESGRPYTIPYPGSSPHVLACGGTKLESISRTEQRESVWNESHEAGVASGGGFSKLFGLPEFQKGHRIGSQRRGIPDVAANAASATGYLIWADNFFTSLGGTSASTPLWAALIACFNESLGRRIGYITPLLYRSRGAFRKILRGNNKLDGRKGYAARKGWDPCTGLGSPHGVKLLATLRRGVED